MAGWRESTISQFLGAVAAPFCSAVPVGKCFRWKCGDVKSRTNQWFVQVITDVDDIHHDDDPTNKDRKVFYTNHESSPREPFPGIFSQAILPVHDITACRIMTVASSRLIEVTLCYVTFVLSSPWQTNYRCHTIQWDRLETVVFVVAVRRCWRVCRLENDEGMPCQSFGKWRNCGDVFFTSVFHSEYGENIFFS